MSRLDPEFLALPLESVRSAALERASQLGCSHAELRVERIRSQAVSLRDAKVETTADDVELGMGIRVVHDGVIGFAATAELDPKAASELAEQATALAVAVSAAATERVELADEPRAGEVEWVSEYDVDPTSVSLSDKVALLESWSDRVLSAPGVDHVTTYVLAVAEDKHYADLTGTITTQRRVRVHPVLEALAVNSTTGEFETMRTIAAPVGRGWEYLQGHGGWDPDAELAELPGLLAAKVAAPSVEPGLYDLVIDPSNLFLTIHESIGHATELDRALGYEAAYAGTSFATFDKLGTLEYGSEIMNVTGDRTTPHGLATVGYDDEGVASQAFDIIRDGVLVGYQLDRRMAAAKGFGRLRLCRLSFPRADPAHGERLFDARRLRRAHYRRPHIVDRPRHLHSRRQELVDRHAEVQLPVHGPAFLPHRQRANQRAAERRRVPIHYDRFLGIHGRGRRKVDIRLRWRLQLR
jgi:TldD protein